MTIPTNNTANPPQPPQPPNPNDIPVQYQIQDGDNEETRRWKLKMQNLIETKNLEIYAKTSAYGHNILTVPSPINT